MEKGDSRIMRYRTILADAAAPSVLLVGVFAAVAQSGLQDARNLLINGSFEEGPAPGNFMTMAAGSTRIPGWTVTRATIDYVESEWPASEGKRSIDLDGSPGAGEIEQTFPAVPGRKYQLSFDLSGNSACAPVVKKLRVTAGNAIGEFTFDTTGKSSGTGWINESLDFAARTSTEAVVFTSLDNSQSQCGPVIDNVSVWALGTPAGRLPSLSGNWLDGLGRRHTVQQQGSKLEWNVETDVHEYEGYIRGRQFDLPYAWYVRMTRIPNGAPLAPEPPPKYFTGRIDLDGTTGELVETSQDGIQSETRLFKIMENGRPAKLRMIPATESAIAGQPIRVQVIVLTASDQLTSADRDYHIRVEAPNANIDNPQIILHAGEPSAAFSVTKTEEGEAMLHARSDPPLEASSQPVYYCGEGAATAVELSSGQQQAPADGRTPIEVMLHLTDGKGHLRANQDANSVALSIQGVGRLNSPSADIPPGRCMLERSIESGSAGATVLTARFGGMQDQREFSFYLVLSVSVFLVVAAGGAGGFLIHLSLHWTKFNRRRLVRILIDLLSGILSGVAVFLVYYAGLVRLKPDWTSSLGVGFLLGLVGGFLGPVAMTRISRIVLPGREGSLEPGVGASSKSLSTIG